MYFCVTFHLTNTEETYYEYEKTVKNILCSALIIVLVFVLSVIFQQMNVQEQITSIFVFAAFLISLITEGYIRRRVSNRLHAGSKLCLHLSILCSELYHSGKSDFRSDYGNGGRSDRYADSKN